jgi:bifunctional DNase/RNase
MSLNNPRPVKVIEVKVDLPEVYPVILFQEIEPPYRTLRFSIGTSEAISISMALKKISAPRPLTHDLFADVLKEFEIMVETVRITGKKDGNYRCELVLSNARFGNKIIDCRPSDGIALALRQQMYVPIVVEESLFDQVQTDVDIDSIKQSEVE